MAVWLSFKEAVIFIILCGITNCEKDLLDTIISKNDDPPELVNFLNTLLDRKNEFKKIREVARAIQKLHRRDNLLDYNENFNEMDRPFNDIYPYSEPKNEEDQFSSREANVNEENWRRRKRRSLSRTGRGLDLSNYNSDDDFGLSSISVVPRSRAGIQKVPGNRYEPLYDKQAKNAHNAKSHSKISQRDLRARVKQKHENIFQDESNVDERPKVSQSKHYIKKKYDRNEDEAYFERHDKPKKLFFERRSNEASLNNEDYKEDLHKVLHMNKKYKLLHKNPSHVVDIVQTITLGDEKPRNDFVNAKEMNEQCCNIPKTLNCNEKKEFAIVYQAKPDLKEVQQESDGFKDKVNTLEDVDEPTSAIEQNELSTKSYDGLGGIMSKADNKAIDLFQPMPHHSPKSFVVQEANNMIHSKSKDFLDTNKRTTFESEQAFLDEFEVKRRSMTHKPSLSKLLDKSLSNEQPVNDGESNENQKHFNSRKLKSIKSVNIDDDRYGSLDYENGKSNGDAFGNKIRVKRNIPEILGMSNDEDYSEDVADDMGVSVYSDDDEGDQTQDSSKFVLMQSRDSDAYKNKRSENDYEEDGDPDAATKIDKFQKKLREPQSASDLLKNPKLVSMDDTVGSIPQLVKSAIAVDNANKEITLGKTHGHIRTLGYRDVPSACICHKCQGIIDGCSNVEPINKKMPKLICTNPKCNCRMPRLHRPAVIDLRNANSSACGETTTVCSTAATFHPKVTSSNLGNMTLKSPKQEANVDQAEFRFNSTNNKTCNTTTTKCGGSYSRGVETSSFSSLLHFPTKIARAAKRFDEKEISIITGEVPNFAHHLAKKPKHKIAPCKMNAVDSKFNLSPIYTAFHTKHNENDFKQVSSDKKRKESPNDEFVGDIKKGMVEDRNLNLLNKRNVLNSVNSFKHITENSPRKRKVNNRKRRSYPVNLHEIDNDNHEDIYDLKAAENAINTAPFEKFPKVYQKYRIKIASNETPKSSTIHKTLKSASMPDINKKGSLERLKRFEKMILRRNRMKTFYNNKRRIKRDNLIGDQKKLNNAHIQVEKRHRDDHGLGKREKDVRCSNAKYKGLLGADKGLNPSLDIKSPANKGTCAIADGSNKQKENYGQLREAASGQLASQIVDAASKKLGKYPKLFSRFSPGLHKTHSVKNEMKGLDEFRNSETQDDIQHTEELLCQIMEVLNKIILDQVHRRTCKHIPPELRHYLARITKTNRSEQRNAEEARISDEGYPLPLVKTGKIIETSTRLTQGAFLFNNDQRASKLEKDEDDIKNKMNMIKELLGQYEHMSKKCKVEVEGVELYLKKHYNMLQNILKHVEKGDSVKKGCKKPEKLKRKSLDFTHPPITPSPSHPKEDFLKRQLENIELENHNLYRPEVNINQLVQQRMNKLLSSPSPKLVDFPNSYLGLHKLRNENFKHNFQTRRDAEFENKISNKYKRLQEATDSVRQKRENEELLGRLFGNVKKRSLTNENYETIKSLNEDEQDNSEVGFETPTVYSLQK